MPKIQKSGNRFHITIPSGYIRFLGWTKGKELTIVSAIGGETDELRFAGKQVNRTE